MANKKISELSVASTPLAGTEEVEIIQGGSNKRVAVSNFGSSLGYTPVNKAGDSMIGDLTMDGTHTVKGLPTATASGEAVPFQQLPPKVIQLACSDETTGLVSGTAKITFRMPFAMTVTSVRASLTTAQTSGSIFTVDINESGTTILSTKITIDNTEKTSTTAVTPPVISDSSLADDSEITIDIDQVGDGTATGLKISIIGS